MRVLLLALLLALPAVAPAPEAVLAGTVTKVVDGDTLVVELDSGPIRVRVYGTDAPEKDQPYGKVAEVTMRTLVRGKPVELIPVEQDQYDRLVAVVLLEGRSVGLTLVEQGYAWAYRQYLGDFDGDEAYCRAEATAREKERGLWAPSAKERWPPWEWRHRTSTSTPTDHDNATADDCVAAIGKQLTPPSRGGSEALDGCTIKGNINSKGERIYHVAGSPNFAITKIDTAKGERWFCSEDEARRAGWRPPR